MKKPLYLLAALIALLFTGNAIAVSLSDGYIIPKDTLSPTGRYGFTVPVFHIDSEINDAHNSLVVAETGKVIARVDGETGYDHSLNHLERVLPWWSEDESVVLWKVDGKWFPNTLVLIKFKNEAQIWQLDLLTIFQNKILAYTKKAAAPEKYEAAKKSNAGCGSAYPEGFTINLEAVGESNFNPPPLQLPLKIHITLTANPKQMENHPNLDAEMDGVIREDGTIQVTHFKLLPPPSCDDL